MDDQLMNPYEERVRQLLDHILPGAYDRLETIENLPSQTGLGLLEVLIEFACQSSNISSILIARDRIRQIPVKWLLTYAPDVIHKRVCFDDEWEYRRLLELARESLPQLLDGFIKRGLSSDNDEVQEAANDFLVTGS